MTIDQKIKLVQALIDHTDRTDKRLTTRIKQINKRQKGLK